MMAVRPHPTKGPGWWQIVISRGRNQKQKVHVFRGTEAEARACEAQIKGVPLKARDSTVVDLLGRFFDWYEIHREKKTNQECRRAFKLLMPFVGAKPLIFLMQTDFDQYKSFRLAAGVTKRTINIELTYFAAFLSWAKDQGHQHGAFPRRFSKKETAPATKTVLSRDELARLIAAVPEEKRPIVQLMAWCGLRRAEALTLQRKAVDLESRVLVVKGKGGKTRIVPIIGHELYCALKTRCETLTAGDYIFLCKRTGKPYQRIQKTLTSAAKRAGIAKHVHHHLLRHSFGTAAITAGVQQRALQGLLGHSDIRTTEIYSHLAADLLQSEAVKLGDWLGVSEMCEIENAKKTK